MVLWLILLVFLTLAILKSPWWWIPTVGLGVQRALVWRRHHKPWWPIHDHALNLYVRAVAYEEVSAKNEGRVFEVKNAIAIMIKQVHPDWKDPHVYSFIFEHLAVRQETNRQSVVNHLLTRRRHVSDEERQEVCLLVDRAFEQPSASLCVRMAIAGVIEEQLGPEAAADYMYQAFLGNA